MVSRVVHFEVPVDDAERAGAFYSAVFDWRISQACTRTATERADRPVR